MICFNFSELKEKMIPNFINHLRISQDIGSKKVFFKMLPDSLISLDLSDCRITSLLGVVFPPKLVLLDLRKNKLKYCRQIEIPESCESFFIQDNSFCDLHVLKLPPKIKCFHASFFSREIKNIDEFSKN
jgi:hypothetical protein